MKKVIYILIILTITLCLFGCCPKGENISGNLTDIMKQLYEEIPTDEIPKLNETKVTKENEEYYLGAKDLKYKEALASEPAMSSIAHSVVLIRMENLNDVEEAKQKILDNIDPRKWICTGVEKENVIVESRGDLIVLIMDNEYATLIKDNFSKLESNS